MLNFPLDIIIIIFELTGASGIKNLSATCKSFNDIIKNPNANCIHTHITYNTKYTSFGKINNSWKKNIHSLVYCDPETGLRPILAAGPLGRPIVSAGPSGRRQKNIIVKFEMTYLKKIVIDRFALNILDVFSSCKNLEKVILKNCTVNSIRPEGPADKLHTLSLFNTSINRIDYLPKTIRNLDLRFATGCLNLSRITKLTKLKTDNCILSINPLNCMLLNYSKLTSVSIYEGETRFIHIDNDILKENVCLKNFKINSSKMDNTNLKLFAPGPGLPRRDLDKLALINTNITDMSELRLYVSSIKKLYMKNNLTKCFNFTKDYADSLEKLVICDSEYYDTLFIKNLPNLKKIYLTGPIDIDINVFINPEKIKTLHLYSFSIVNLNNIFKFKNLKHLYIDTTHNIQNIYDSILSISQCTRLETLGFNVRGVDKFAMDYLVWPFGTLPVLKKLDVTNIGISDFSFIPNNIELCSLYKKEKEYYTNPGNCNISFF